MRLPFLLIFILCAFVSAFSQGKADSLVAHLQDKNLNVLNQQLVMLASHPVRISVEPDKAQWTEAYAKLGEKAIARSQSFSPEAQAMVLANVSEVMVREGNVVPGYSLATKALRKAVNTKSLVQAYVFSKYSDILKRLNYLDSSILYTEKMLDVAHEFRNDSTERLALDQLSMQCYRIRNYPKSEFYLRQLVNHPSTTERNQMDYFNTLALTFRRRQMYDTSNWWFEKSLVKAIALKDTAWIGLVSGNIGFNNFLAGHRHEALPNLLLDLNYSFHTKQYRSGLSALTTIISICLDDHNLPLAHQYYDTLANNMWRGTDNEIKLDFLNTSTDFFEKSGEPAKALYYSRKAYRFRDSIENLNNTAKASDLEAQFDFNRQLRKIQSLEQQSSAQQANNQWKNYLLIGTSFFIILGIGFIFLLQRSNRFKFQTNRILQEQNIKISQQADNLNELNATKDKLLSIISHDLRGPVNSLKALISMATKKIISPEEFNHFLGQLEKNVETVNFTLDNVLYWSRSQLRGIQTKPVSTGMAELIDETFNLFSEPVITKGITVENTVSHDINVFADPDQIRLVLRNLISNAIKFTNNGGKIIIRSAAKKDQEVISVSDTGVGMSADVASTLFTSNDVHTTTGTSGEKGTGLGLSLCREMIERNQGKIWVESVEGAGTTFFFTLIRTS